jgi:hypothetical protein
MTSPSGQQEKHWYNVWGDPPSTQSDPGKYAEPLARARPQAGSTGRYLATEWFECPEGVCASASARQKYIQQTSNQWSGFARVETESTVFEDGTQADVRYYDYDGFGHFREAVTGGNYPGLNVRTSYTNFNPGVSADGKRNGTFAFPTTTPWLLNTYTDRSTTENGHTAKQEACFDANGFLQRVRTLTSDAATAGAVTRGGDDLLSVFTNDSHGNVERESYYGGDVRTGVTALGTGELCGLPLPASPQYELRHTYSHGVRATSRYVSGGADMPYLTVDRDIALSGEVTAEREQQRIHDRVCIRHERTAGDGHAARHVRGVDGLRQRHRHDDPGTGDHHQRRHDSPRGVRLVRPPLA